MIDVDGMKAINDTYGHQVGDAVLQAVAAALSKDSAIVGRYGGDEFAAILPGADRQSAEHYREEVLVDLRAAELRDPDSGAGVPVSASVGLAIYPAEADKLEELIKLADSAMYAAKRQRPTGAAGKNLPRPLGSERAARLVGELVPLLTSPGDLDNKLRLVAHRLSVGAGYDGVYFSLHGPHPGPPLASSAFARVPDKLIDAWRRVTHAHRGEPDVIRAQLDSGRRPIIMEDVQSDERLDEETRNLLRAAGLCSGLIAPMLWRDEMIGSLAVASKQKSAFGPRDAQFLMAVATEVTAIVRMATLVEELQSTSGHLARARAEAVIMLAAAAEFHDLTTGLHLQNVRAVTEALARELGHSEEEAGELGLAAVLHDIGKVRVPDSVLSSTGQLADEEWELMKHHTTWGGEFLAGRPGFELAAIVARSHHERWDGSGYPHGLAGQDIPEAATIVSVADAFDAMTSDRPYRTARSTSAAVREIVQGSGKQFSPRVVEALVRLRRRKMLPLPHRQALEEVAA
jgi:diguanylate cyclase (GGDEF)-like protein